MPVFTKVRDGILVIAIDGDYTPQELRRVGEAGVTDPATPSPVRAILDMSGAAGLPTRSLGELSQTAEFLTGLEALIAVAVLAPDDATYGLMRMAAPMLARGGTPVAVFRTRDEAAAWLDSQ